MSVVNVSCTVSSSFSIFCYSVFSVGKVVVDVSVDVLVVVVIVGVVSVGGIGETGDSLFSETPEYTREPSIAQRARASASRRRRYSGWSSNPSTGLSARIVRAGLPSEASL
jgi:hypothetical protein